MVGKYESGLNRVYYVGTDVEGCLHTFAEEKLAGHDTELVIIRKALVAKKSELKLLEIGI